ncbi:MAG: penicillin-binding protein activator, partial [Desulfobacula sp.]|nr:penicillin-binding protein activator [Desulfobacula sp.]
MIAIIIILSITSCTRLPEQKPIEKQPITKPAIQPSIEQKEPEEKVSLIDILIAEAQKFVATENFQDALFVYNQALSQANENQTLSLIEAVEAILSQMPSDEINAFAEIKNLKIPRSLLLYWVGLNAALESKNEQAKLAFETFLFETPEHPYAQDVEDLLSVIKKSLFKKNTIGCLLPLTGKYAIVGQQALRGIQLAIQTLSKTYNKEFHLIIKDTQANPEKAVEAVQQLYQQKVAAILGPLLTVSQAGREAEKLGIPMIGLTQKYDFPSQGEFLFSNFISPQMQVNTLGVYLFRELGIKKVAILYPDEKYGKRYMELFWDVVDEYDVQVVGVEPYDGKKTDFTIPIQKLTGQFFPVPNSIKQEEKKAEKLALAAIAQETFPFETDQDQVLSDPQSVFEQESPREEK